MNLVKSREYFNPDKILFPIHILGCGATGSTIAELLTRFGAKELYLYDMDIVEDKNIANQIYRNSDINKKKTDALEDILKDINPDIIIHKKEKYTNQILTGFVFLCVDSIEVHKSFVTNNFYNLDIEAVFETRMGYTEGQHYAAQWIDLQQKKTMKEYQNFSQEEADANNVTSGCNETISLATNIRILCNYTVINFINYINTGNLQTMVVSHPFDYQLMNFRVI